MALIVSQPHDVLYILEHKRVLFNGLVVFIRYVKKNPVYAVSVVNGHLTQRCINLIE